MLRALQLVLAVPDEGPEEPLAMWVGTLKTAPSAPSSESSKPDSEAVA